MALISSADALTALQAAGRSAFKSSARGRCQTLSYCVDGQYVNLGRLRQLAQELTAPEPVAEPVAVVAEPVAPATPEPVAPVAQARPRSLAPLAADLAQSLGLGRGGTIRPARRPVTLPGEEGRPPAPVAQGPGPELPTLATLSAKGAA